MDFEQKYEQFIQSHMKRRKDERCRRLLDHGYAEKRFLQNVWWPAFQHFDNLHPEYEIQDFRDGYRYIDYAFIQPYFRIAIEIDGFGPHWRNITKAKFTDHDQRQNHLVIDGWHVLRFTLEHIDEHPRLCQQTIHQLMGRLLGDASSVARELNIVEREIIRLAMKSPRPITPGEVADMLRATSRTAAAYMQKLCDTSWLQPASGSQRVRCYRLHPSRKHLRL